MEDVFTCTECGGTYTMAQTELVLFEFAAPNGEPFEVSLAACPICESVQLPERYNKISFVLPKETYDRISIQK